MSGSLVDELNERFRPTEDERVREAVRVQLPRKHPRALRMFGSVGRIAATVIDEVSSRSGREGLGVPLAPVMAVAFTGERLLLIAYRGWLLATPRELLGTFELAELAEVYFSMRGLLLTVSFINDAVLETEVLEKDRDDAQSLAARVKARLAAP